eukprot:TRINITY_DN15612_c0_g1_i1.p1 TRINITY_DN15612_c0_g1~~TRINITY_DN15612_c0_g1_i1.p1  ORF type:complete len:331 (+),score=84.46 TRINITY_DN15612_c0_g1_i1:53-1045(+)
MNKELLKKAASNSCGMPPPPASMLPPPPKGRSGGKVEDIKPITPQECFDEVQSVDIGGDSFRVYKGKGPEGCGKHMLLIHGAGLCGMSWGLCAAELKKHVNVVTYDMRGHGETVCKDGTDMSIATITNDAVNIIKTCIPKGSKYMIVGHSLGGAVAASAANHPDLLPGLGGCAVVDVVEGTAIESLKHMKSILAKKPLSFTSLSKAIHWGMSGAGLRNMESARASIPAQLKEKDGLYTWRTDLLSTEPYWEEWFLGLDTWFLSAKCPKLLLVASPDRLDRELSLAHMQGKFQLSIIANTGHYMQEDSPQEMCRYLSSFFARHTAPIPGPF